MIKYLKIFLLIFTLNVLFTNVQAQNPYLVKNFATVNEFSSNPNNITNVNGISYFFAKEEQYYSALWKSDGTENGTSLVKDLFLSDNITALKDLTNMDNTLFFMALLDGRWKLWKSDGTENGTIQVKDIILSYQYDSALVAMDGVLFFTAGDTTNGSELWKSDGTEIGTVLVKDILLGNQSSNPKNLINVNGVLFFTVDRGINGRELWKSDGTEIGTVMVKDDYFNTVGPRNLTNVNDVLYFIAKNKELWIQRSWLVKNPIHPKSRCGVLVN